MVFAIISKIFCVHCLCIAKTIILLHTFIVVVRSAGRISVRKLAVCLVRSINIVIILLLCSWLRIGIIVIFLAQTESILMIMIILRKHSTLPFFNYYLHILFQYCQSINKNDFQNRKNVKKLIKLFLLSFYRYFTSLKKF